jgi:hypothetical protein
MKPLKSLALVAAMAAVTISPAMAELVIIPSHTATPSLGQTPSYGGASGLLLRLRCAVQGTPSEFPNDIRIWRNVGGISAGTVVTWTLPSTGETGTAVLPAVPAGQSYFLSNVLPGGREAGTPCAAS